MMRSHAGALALALVLSGCPEKAPPPAPTEAPATSTATAAASASPADVAAATKAWDTFKARIDAAREAIAPYRLEKKRPIPCAKRDGAEPAVMIDYQHATTAIRRHQDPHWGRVAAELEVLQYKGFLESDKKDMRDWPFDPKGALRLIEKLNGAPSTILIDVEETRPDVGGGDAYTPGKAKGVAWVADSKGTVCTIPLEYQQSGTVKFDSLVFEDDPEFSAIDKQASASVAVKFHYDRAIASQLEEKLRVLGWTSVLGPRTPKK